MITNFENQTEDLNEQEKVFAPLIEKYLKMLLSEKKPVKQVDLCDQVNFNFVYENGPNVFSINMPRLRKYFNYFRSNGILPIIATSDGCYLSNDNLQIEKQIKSLEERARQIQRAADGMKKLLK